MSRKDRYAGDMVRDEVFHTVLDGIARHTGDPFLADLAETVKRYADPYLAHALNKNQMASKGWLAGALADAATGPVGTAWVLGGWYGVMGALLLADPRLAIERVLSIDLDPDCVEIAEFLNRRHVAEGRFIAVTADMHGLDYEAPKIGDDAGGDRPGLIVNTSCEHLDPFADWYARLPAGVLLALQSNDMFDEPVHTNCVADLNEFRAQATMADELYGGALELKRYTRFMLIGRK